ncbi:MAG: DUF530 family protein [Candidatus Micrarchaeota archaeon]
MSESLRLANEANNYMDAINNSSEILDEREEKLQELKAKMIWYGFNSPFRVLVARAREERQENSAEEAQDQKKHTKQIRYIASLKKFTLNRTRVAIAAHKIAKALQEFGNEEVVKYLPLNGAYRKMLTDAGESAVEAYRKLLTIFEQKRYPMKTASALISLMQDGMEVERTVQIDANKDARKAIEKMFGKNAKVKDVQLKRKAAGLIKNYSTKVALFTMAALHAAEEAGRKLLEEEEGNGALKKYNQILRESGLSADCSIIESERFEDVKKRMVKEGFVQKIGYDWVMDEEFEALLYRRRQEKKRNAMNEADLLVYRLLQWYYITMHKDSRMVYGAMPSVLANPDEARLSVLQELAPPGYAVKHPPKVIGQKLKMEENAPPMNSRAWGPAFLCIKAKVDAKWAAEEMNVDEGEIASAIPIVKGLVEKPEGRGAEFLQKLKERG